MKKILLVDNVRSILEREKGLLNRDIFQIFTAVTGEEALAIHKREKADVIIMDLHMPKMPGDEVCRAMRSDPEMKKVSILLATLLDDDDEIKRCTQAGANGHIKKPIDRHELAEKLAKLLGIPARQAIRILVKVKLDGRLGSDFFIANTVDVSVSGLLFECEREVNVGDYVETSFFLAGSGGYNRVVVRSEVMRIAPSDRETKRYGVMFREFKEGSAELIKEFIEKKTGKLS